MDVAPARLKDVVKADYDKWTRIIQAVGIRLE